jgi:ketosteroid isomerase-like protein
MTSTAVEPTALTHEFYRLVDAGDLDGLAARFTEDASYARPGYPVLAGRAAIDHFYRYDRVIASGRHTLESIVVSGHEIAVRGSFAGQLRDGSPVAHRFAEFFVIDTEGRITGRETFFAVAHV